jgi:plasmid rolling circle replication initiator protein Rep
MGHENLSCDRESLRLSDLSPRDITWEVVKPQSQIVANAYAGTAYDKYSQRVEECSGWLRFALVPNDGGEIIHKLQSAHFCHVRHCPICQWRKSLMWRAKAFRAVARAVTDYPGKRFIYLTLTVRNCDVNELGATLAWMNDSWQRLAERKEFPAIGWLRSTEVTRGKDGTAHPHFHALLMVNSNYFTKGYLSQKRWRELWAESLRIDYDPQVDIKVVKPAKTSTTVTSESDNQNDQEVIRPIDPGLEAAIRYTLKYSTKPDDYLSTDTSVSQVDEDFKSWLITLTQQLHKRKSVSTGGVFKKYLAEDDPRNLIRDEGNTDTSETEDEDPRITYVWRDEVTQYLLKV